MSISSLGGRVTIDWGEQRGNLLGDGDVLYLNQDYSYLSVYILKVNQVLYFLYLRFVNFVAQ